MSKVMLSSTYSHFIFSLTRTTSRRLLIITPVLEISHSRRTVFKNPMSNTRTPTRRHLVTAGHQRGKRRRNSKTISDENGFIDILFGRWTGKDEALKYLDSEHVEIETKAVI